jgi:hypothetical protein
VRACVRACFGGTCACLVCVYGVHAHAGVRIDLRTPHLSLFPLPYSLHLNHSLVQALSLGRALFARALSRARAHTHTLSLSLARARSCSRTFNSLPSTPDDLAIEGGEPLKEEVRWRGGLGGRATEPD